MAVKAGVCSKGWLKIPKPWCIAVGDICAGNLQAFNLLGRRKTPRHYKKVIEGLVIRGVYPINSAAKWKNKKNGKNRILMSRVRPT